MMSLDAAIESLGLIILNYKHNDKTTAAATRRTHLQEDPELHLQIL